MTMDLTKAGAVASVMSASLAVVMGGPGNTQTTRPSLEFLRAADLPCTPALSVAEFMDDPQVLANEMVEAVEQPPLGKVREI